MKPGINYRIILCILLWAGYLAGPGEAAGQKVSVTSELDTNYIMIGDPVVLKWKFSFPADNIPVIPVFGDTLSKQIEVLSLSGTDTMYSADKKSITLTQNIRITCFDSGVFMVPALHFGIRRAGDTASALFGTSPLPLFVNTVKVDTTKGFIDIVGPMNEPIGWRELLPWILGGLGLLFLLAGGFYIFLRRRRKQPVFPVHTTPAEPPHLTALTRLEELRLKRLCESGRIKEYYSSLSEILREYIHGRFGLDAMEMVTSDITSALQECNPGDEALRICAQVLTLADMVKFARYEPLPADHDQGMKSAVSFVQITIPAEPLPEVESNPNPQNPLP